MKKISLLLLVFFLFACSFVQYNWAQQGFLVGGTVFPLRSFMLNATDSAFPEDTLGYQPTYGVAFGPIAGYSFNNYFTVLFNPLYSAQGQSYSYYYNNAEGQKEKVRIDTRLRYFKLPLLFKCHTNAARFVSVGFMAGPQLDILASVEEYDSDKRYQPFPPYDVTYTNYPNRFDTFAPFVWSGVMGLNLDVKLRYNLKMNSYIRLDYALQDVEDKSEAFIRTQDGVSERTKFYSMQNEVRFGNNRTSSHNATIAIGLGFTYLFAKKFHY
jgi:hypothetical protein